MNVLLAIDGSSHSDAAVEEVASRHWPSNTAVEVLTAVHSRVPLIPDPALTMAAVHVEHIREQMAQAPALVEQAASRLRRQLPWVTVTTKIVEGSPTEAILHEASDWRADLIVLGSHGRSPITQAILGSVASGIAAEAPCAVEIIRQGRSKVHVGSVA
jgi:nucleotide-binding universal stress UspA family protein